MRKSLYLLGLGALLIAACLPTTGEISPTVTEDGSIQVQPVASETDAFSPLTTTESNPAQFEGTIVFYSDMAGNPDIYAIQADGSGLLQLTADPASDDSPALSPDGTQVAFLSARDDPDPQFPNLKYEIYLVQVDGTGLTRLTTTAAAEDHPAWAPDGRRLLFDADYDGDGFYEIYSMAVDGTDLVRLTTGEHNDQFADWSPDGQQIAFASDRNGGWDIFVMDAAGGDPQALTTGKAWELFPAWSPDGEWIAYNTLTPGSRNTDIAVMDRSGGEVMQLTDAPGFDENPAWSPDGQWLAFQTERTGDFQIFVMRPDGTAAQPLFACPSDALWPSWGSSPTLSD